MDQSPGGPYVQAGQKDLAIKGYKLQLGNLPCNIAAASKLKAFGK
jgi:hypothetical protein